MDGWIDEGWCHYEGELLIQLRERMDGRMLLGNVFRVLHDRESWNQDSWSWCYWMMKDTKAKKTSPRCLQVIIESLHM